jgi:AcrR family transcriptional regulator
MSHNNNGESIVFMRSSIKIPKRSRGRPPKFDADTVLDSAMRVFWAHGFAGTSLDHLGEAMRMSRPSIANAFGDKQGVYRMTLARFVEKMKVGAAATLADEPDLRKALMAFYDAALEVYCGSRKAPGCFVFCTAPVEAPAHPDVQRDLRRIIAELDGLLAARFGRAQRDGEFPKAADADAVGRLEQAILHSLAIRARAGEPRAKLHAMAQRAVRMLTGMR